MKKMIVIISLIAILCLSGGYALMFENTNIFEDSDNPAISEETKEDIVSSNVVDTIISNDESEDTYTIQETISEKVISNDQNNKNQEIDPLEQERIYVFKDQIYILKEDFDNLTDRYSQCVECGKFIPVGEVTTPLPEDAICRGTNGFGNANWGSTVSYEFAYSYYETWLTSEEYLNAEFIQKYGDWHVDVGALDFINESTDNYPEEIDNYDFSYEEDNYEPIYMLSVENTGGDCDHDHNENLDYSIEIESID